MIVVAAAAATTSPPPTRPRRDRVVPGQHGAWAFLALPLALAMTRDRLVPSAARGRGGLGHGVPPELAGLVLVVVAVALA